MIEMEDDLRWLRCREAACLLNVSVSTVRAWLQRGYLEGFKIDGLVRIDRLSIERLARTHRYADKHRRAEVATRPGSPDLYRPRGTTG